MAVTYDTQGSGEDFGVTSVTSAAFTVANVADRAAHVHLAFFTGTLPTIANVTCAGQTCAVVTNTAAASTDVSSVIYGVAAPSTGSQTAHASWTGAQTADIGAIIANGVDQTTPANNGANTNGTGDSVSIVATSELGELTTSVWVSGDATGIATNQTATWTQAGRGDRGPGTANPTHTWTKSFGGATAMSLANFNKPADGPPLIIDQPTDQVAIFGNAATFTVNASSQTGAALSYQWTENGANIGTNASSFTTTQSYTADQNARFAASVWDAQGTTQSANAYLRLTIGSGYYVQETVSSDRYTMEDAGGFYIIEPWGGAAAANNLGPFFIGPLNGLGTGGFFFKDRLH